MFMLLNASRISLEWIPYLFIIILFYLMIYTNKHS